MALIIGSIAAILTCLCNLPQLIKIFKTKDAKSVSYGTYIILDIALFLWLVYGALICAWPLVVESAISIMIVTTVLTVKKYYDKQKGVK